MKVFRVFPSLPQMCNYNTIFLNVLLYIIRLYLHFHLINALLYARLLLWSSHKLHAHKCVYVEYLSKKATACIWTNLAYLQQHRPGAQRSGLGLRRSESQISNLKLIDYCEHSPVNASKGAYVVSLRLKFKATDSDYRDNVTVRWTTSPPQPRVHLTIFTSL